MRSIRLLTVVMGASIATAAYGQSVYVLEGDLPVGELVQIVGKGLAHSPLYQMDRVHYCGDLGPMSHHRELFVRVPGTPGIRSIMVYGTLQTLFDSTNEPGLGPIRPGVDLLVQEGASPCEGGDLEGLSIMEAELVPPGP